MEYHKIETLYERGTDFKVNPAILKNPVYGIIKTWQFTEKIDGTNMRAIWQDGKLSFNGRTDNSQIPGDLLKHMYETISPDVMNTLFSGSKAVVYGEGYGAGIQKGGGDYSPTKRFIIFDVLVEDKWWLNWVNVIDIAGKLGHETVPYLGEMTLEAATNIVRAGFQSRLNGGKKQAEGLVGRPVEALFDKKGARLIIKLKTKDF